MKKSVRRITKRSLSLSNRSKQANDKSNRSKSQNRRRSKFKSQSRKSLRCLSNRIQTILQVPSVMATVLAQKPQQLRQRKELKEPTLLSTNCMAKSACLTS